MHLHAFKSLTIIPHTLCEMKSGAAAKQASNAVITKCLHILTFVPRTRARSPDKLATRHVEK